MDWLDKKCTCTENTCNDEAPQDSVLLLDLLYIYMRWVYVSYSVSLLFVVIIVTSGSLLVPSEPTPLL